MESLQVIYVTGPFINLSVHSCPHENNVYPFSQLGDRLPKYSVRTVIDSLPVQAWTEAVIAQVGCVHKLKRTRTNKSVFVFHLKVTVRIL